MSRINVLEHQIHVDNREAKREMDEYTNKVRSTAQKTTQQTATMSAGFTKLRTSIGLVGAGMAGLGVGAVFASVSRFMDQAERVQSVTAGFETLTRRTDETAQQWLTAMRPAAQGLLTDLQLMQQANNAIILGLPVTADRMANLTEKAIKLGRALGQTAEVSIASFVTGVGRQSRLMLDNIGVIVRAEEAYAQYAKTLGITADLMTEAQRKTAFALASFKAIDVASAGLTQTNTTLSDSYGALGTSIANVWNRMVRIVNEGVPIQVEEQFNSFERFIQGMAGRIGALSLRMRGFPVVDPQSTRSTGGVPETYPGAAALKAAAKNVDEVKARGEAMRAATENAFAQWVVDTRAARTEIEGIERAYAQLDELARKMTPLGPTGFAPELMIGTPAPPGAEDVLAMETEAQQRINEIRYDLAAEGSRERMELELGFVDQRQRAELERVTAILGEEHELTQAMKEAHHNNLMAIETEHYEWIKAQERATAAYKRSVMIQTIGNFAQGAVILFGNQKAAATANAIINTAQGVSAALALGPILGIPLAASIAALGAAQVYKIQSTNIGSGAAAIGAGVALAGSTYNAVGPAAAQARATEVTIFIEGAAFVQDITEFARTISGEIDSQLNRVGAPA